MRTISIALGLVVLQLASAPAQAASFLGSECPLIDTRYKTLLDSAIALEKNVQMPAQCDQERAQLRTAHEKLFTAANRIQALDRQTQGFSADGSLTEGERLAAQEAMSGLQALGTLTRVGRPECRQGMFSNPNYTMALLDTVNSLLPYAILAGGPVMTPYVLAGGLLVSVVRVFAEGYAARNATMATGAVRQAFIQNACGYFKLNEAVLAIEETSRMSRDQLRSELERTERSLRALSTRNPYLDTRLDGALTLASIQASVQKDKLTVESLEKGWAELATEPFRCALVRKVAHDKSLGLEASRRLKALLELARSGSSSDELFAHEVMADQLEAVPQPEVLDPARPADCARTGDIWIKTLGAVVRASERRVETLIAASKVEAEKSSSARTRLRKWNSEFTAARQSVLEAQARLALQDGLAAGDGTLEKAELHRLRESIGEALFGAAEKVLLVLDKDSPGVAWVKLQLKDTHEALKRFKPLAETGLRLSAASAACPSLNEAWIGWLSARRYLEAKHYFCRTFEENASRVSFPEVVRGCNGRVAWERTQELEASRAEFARVEARIKKLGCSRQ